VRSITHACSWLHVEFKGWFALRPSASDRILSELNVPLYEMWNISSEKVDRIPLALSGDWHASVV